MIVGKGQTVNIGRREYHAGDEIPDAVAKAAGLNVPGIARAAEAIPQARETAPQAKESK